MKGSPAGRILAWSNIRPSNLAFANINDAILAHQSRYGGLAFRYGCAILGVARDSKARGRVKATAYRAQGAQAAGILGGIQMH